MIMWSLTLWLNKHISKFFWEPLENEYVKSGGLLFTITTAIFEGQCKIYKIAYAKNKWLDFVMEYLEMLKKKKIINIM